MPGFSTLNEEFSAGKRPTVREIDGNAQKRARRMFGSILGTLAKARCEFSR